MVFLVYGLNSGIFDRIGDGFDIVGERVAGRGEVGDFVGS
jgi:hypothetical protein